MGNVQSDLKLFERILALALDSYDVCGRERRLQCPLLALVLMWNIQLFGIFTR